MRHRERRRRRWPGGLVAAGVQAMAARVRAGPAVRAKAMAARVRAGPAVRAKVMAQAMAEAQEGR